MGMKAAAETVVECLETTGTPYVFGYPGGQNMRFIEALQGSRVEFVLVTHEACAGFMADVSARLTGKVGACLSTLGPGATNMTTGVGNAFLDRVPVLAFTATMGRRWRGRTVQMQIDHRKLYAPITKWTTELRAGEVGPIMRKAVRIAQAEVPGPVHIDFPEDTAEETAEEVCPAFPAPRRLAAPEESTLRKAAKLLTGSRHPLVAVGLTMNRAGATAELREFVRRNDLPVVSTMMAKGHIDQGGPNFVGVVGRARRDIVAEYCRAADLVIAFGYDPVEFNYEDWLPKGAPLIHVDTVPADIAAWHPGVCNVVGDIRVSLERFLRLPSLMHAWKLQAREAHRRKLEEAFRPSAGTFTPQLALSAMRDLLTADGILVADVGAHTHLIGQWWDAKEPGRLLVSNGWSSMGFAVPAAIAAKLVLRNQPVAACVGDGGFLMMVGEIATAVRLGLPVVFVVFRDNFLSLIRVKQDRKKFLHAGVELFAGGYKSSDTFFGADVTVAGSEEEFREAFRKGLEGGKPVVIEALVDPSEYDRLI